MVVVRVIVLVMVTVVMVIMLSCPSSHPNFLTPFLHFSKFCLHLVQFLEC